MKTFLMSILIAVVMCVNSWGAMTGTEINGTGLYSSNAFNAPLTWSVNHNNNGTWTYQYSFTPSGTGRGVAFINLEIGGTPTLTGTSSVSTGNPAYLDPNLQTKSPVYSPWTLSGATPSWTTNSYANLSYSFQYTTNYSTAYQGVTGTQLDKAIAFDASGNVTSAATVLSQYGTIDVRPNSSFLNSNGKIPALPQFDSGSDTSGRVSTTMNGLTWFLPSWEAYPGSSKASGSAGGPPSQTGTVTGFNAGWTLSLTTTAAPMWGDFFLDGGDWKSDGYYLEASNSGYNQSAGTFTYTDGLAMTNAGFVPTPNFASAPVPIPAAAWLFGSGLSGLIFFRRKRPVT